MGVRKNQSTLTGAEWTAFINAIKAMHGSGAGAPAYRAFVKVHIRAMSASGMSWHVHTMNMGGMLVRGFNFLPWHRRLLRLFEQRLQQVNATVTVPYWNSVADRQIPAQLGDPALLTALSVERDVFDPSQLGDPSDLAAIQTFSGTFRGFQALLEGAVHAGAHNAVGGDMAESGSPTDPRKDPFRDQARTGCIL